MFDCDLPHCRHNGKKETVTTPLTSFTQLPKSSLLWTPLVFFCGIWSISMTWKDWVLSFRASRHSFWYQLHWRTGWQFSKSIGNEPAAAVLFPEIFNNWRIVLLDDWHFWPHKVIAFTAMPTTNRSSLLVLLEFLKFRRRRAIAEHIDSAAAYLWNP